MPHPVMAALQANPASGFNPENDITWHSLFWAEGTGFKARGYSDGGTVSTWDNETGETDATSGNTKVTYDEVDTNLNNQPSVAFNGTNGALETAAFSVNPTYSISIVAIISLVDTAANRTICDNYASPNHRLFFRGSDDKIAWKIGTTTTASTFVAGAGAHGVVATADGSTGNETITVAGTTYLNTNVGDDTISGLSIGKDTGSAHVYNGTIALIGIYEGDVTADGSWSDFQTWASDHYGVTI